MTDLSATEHLQAPLKTIQIGIASNYANNVINFLIDHSIPFNVESKIQSHPVEAVAPMPLSVPNQELVFEGNPRQSYDSKIAEFVCKKYIENELEGASPVIEDIAKEMKVSVSKLKSVFREHYKMPFYQYYLTKKMEHAASLLSSGMRAKDVAARVGYPHPIKFTKMFQKHFNVNPKKYQQGF